MSCCTVQICSKPAPAGFRLCRNCHDRLRRELAGLPELYEDVLGLSHYRYDELARARKASGICLNEAALAVRTDMVDLLVSWSVLVVEERAVRGPGRRGLPELVEFLIGHLDWLAAHPAAADLSQEIADVAALAHRAIEPEPVRGAELGRCARPGCDRTVRAVTDDSLARQVSCDAGHVWRPHEWLLLRRVA